ncbi:hypothetical protein RI054_27g112570 [Pseudoscourfieldia marina]
MANVANGNARNGLEHSKVKVSLKLARKDTNFGAAPAPESLAPSNNGHSARAGAVPVAEAPASAAVAFEPAKDNADLVNGSDRGTAAAPAGAGAGAGGETADAAAAVEPPDPEGYQAQVGAASAADTAATNATDAAAAGGGDVLAAAPPPAEPDKSTVPPRPRPFNPATLVGKRVRGVIDARFPFGYLITVTMEASPSGENSTSEPPLKVRGILYHDPSTAATLSTEHGGASGTERLAVPRQAPVHYPTLGLDPVVMQTMAPPPPLLPPPPPPPDGRRQSNANRNAGLVLPEELAKRIFERNRLLASSPDDGPFQKRKRGGQVLQDGEVQTTPKNPRTAFNYFSAEVREGVKERMPGVRDAEISRRIGEMWKRTPPADREKYEEASRRDKERFKREKEMFQEALRAMQEGRDVNAVFAPTSDEANEGKDVDADADADADAQANGNAHAAPTDEVDLDIDLDADDLDGTKPTRDWREAAAAADAAMGDAN